MYVLPSSLSSFPLLSFPPSFNPSIPHSFHLSFQSSYPPTLLYTCLPSFYHSFLPSLRPPFLPSFLPPLLLYLHSSYLPFFLPSCRPNPFLPPVFPSSSPTFLLPPSFLPPVLSSSDPPVLPVLLPSFLILAFLPSTMPPAFLPYFSRRRRLEVLQMRPRRHDNERRLPKRINTSPPIVPSHLLLARECDARFGRGRPIKGLSRATRVASVGDGTGPLAPLYWGIKKLSDMPTNSEWFESSHRTTRRTLSNKTIAS